MAVEVLVPPLGQTVETLTLVSWYKQEGETVAQGEPLFSVETDKATLDVEAPASGVLRGVRAAPGDQVKVLAVIATIGAATSADPAPGESPAPAGAGGAQKKSTGITDPCYSVSATKQK